MAVDMGRMRKNYQEQQRGGEFIQFQQGETLCYIHPPCRANDKWEPTTGLNYIPVVIHYAIGKGNAMVVSLDPETNPILEHPFIKKLLKAKKIRLTGKDPVAAWRKGKEITDEEADDSRPQTRYLWGMTPLKHRGDSSEEWRKLNAKPGIAMIGKTLYDGLMEAFFDNGDISDPDAAILVKVIRTGTGRMNTKYKVKIDPDTLKRNLKIPAKLRAALKKAMAEGGDCDLFKVVANMVKGPEQVQALLDGVKTSEDPDEFDDDVEDDEAGEEDDEAELDALEDEDEDEEESEDDDTEEADEEESEDEEADEEESEDEDDDTEEADEDEEESDEEESEDEGTEEADEDEEESDEEESEDEDDLGLDELEAQLEEMDEEEPAPKKKSKKKAKSAPPAAAKKSKSAPAATGKKKAKKKAAAKG